MDRAELTVDDERARIENSLRRVHRLGFWLDDAFEVPIIGRRIGLDPIIGLVPGAGDWAMWLLSVYILFEAVRLEVPVRLLVKMASNIAIDLLVGVVPLVGDLADMAVKANRKNARLLLEHCHATVDGTTVRFHESPLLRERSSSLSRWSAALALVVGLFAMVAAPVALLAWLWP